MIKTLKLYGIKSRPLFWQLLGAAVLQIALGLIWIFAAAEKVISLEGGNSGQLSAYIDKQTYYNLIIPVPLLLIGLFFVLICSLKSDYKHCSTYAVNKMQNYYANILIALTVAVCVGVIGLVSDLISLCAVRSVDGFWTNDMLDIKTFKYILTLCGKNILAIFSLTMLGYLIKEFFVRSKAWTIGAVIAIGGTIAIIITCGSLLGMDDFVNALFEDKWLSLILGLVGVASAIGNFIFAKFLGVKR